MDVKEKILLVELLLEDIRGNWGYCGIGRNAIDRALKAASLCEEIAEELNDDRYLMLQNACNAYINNYYDGDSDGRWFREEFPDGYENMEKLHGLPFTFLDKSEEFQEEAEEFLTYPQFRFDDWQEREKQL